jgi:hypothetical protein
MVIVASGTSDQVLRWSAILGRAAIVFSVVQPCSDDSLTNSDHWELWVAREDAERGRTAIGATDHIEQSLLW